MRPLRKDIDLQTCRRMRDEEGLSQKQIAEALGVSPSLVSQWIGKRRGERQAAIPSERPPVQPSVADFDDPRPEEQRRPPMMPCALVFRGRCVEYRLDKRGGVVLHPLAQEPIPLCQLKAEVEGVLAYWQEHRKANLAP